MNTHARILPPSFGAGGPLGVLGGAGVSRISVEKAIPSFASFENNRYCTLFGAKRDSREKILLVSIFRRLINEIARVIYIT